MFILTEATWLAICFIIFWILLYKPIKQFINRFLDKKINNISQEIDHLQKLKSEISSIVIEYRKRNAQLENEKQEIFDRAKLLAENIIASKKDQTQWLIEQKERQLRSNLQSARYKLDQAIKQDIIVITYYIVEKYLQTKKDLLPSDYQICLPLLKNISIK